MCIRDSYKVEPYVVSADIYTNPQHAGRGGWTWYTGSAGWLYQLVIESLLGLKRTVDRLHLAPKIPSGWESFEVYYRHHHTSHHCVAESSGRSARFHHRRPAERGDHHPGCGRGCDGWCDGDGSTCLLYTSILKWVCSIANWRRPSVKMTSNRRTSWSRLRSGTRLVVSTTNSSACIVSDAV